MGKKIFLKILVATVTLVLLIKIITTIFIEPWIGGKIRTELNKKDRNFIVEIDKVNILLVKSGIKLTGITILSNPEHGGDPDLKGEIASVKLTGINLARAIFRHDIYINKLTFSNSIINGKFPFSGRALQPVVSPMSLGIGRILFDELNLEMKDDSTGQTYSVKDGMLKAYDLQVGKLDTVFPGTFKLFDFTAGELSMVSSDKMYSYVVKGISYPANLNTLFIDSLFIRPNYADYDFTSRYAFQTNRIEAALTDIYVYDFDSEDYLRSMSLKSPYIEIGQMDMKVFRDKRIEFRHLNKPAFQDILYDFPHPFMIDSIILMKGNVTFTVHAEEASEPGLIKFNEIHARLFKLTNDTIYKTEKAFLEIKADALLMGKGKMAVHLKERIFDSNNTFSLEGTLSGLNVTELNPILEKSAFFYATSGKIDAMSFSFIANNDKATGKMTMLYHGLDIAVKNKQTDDTTALRERFVSYIANRRIPDSNPVHGEDFREGTIDYIRDPERSVLHYCFRSILSGITSTLADGDKKMEDRLAGLK
jgi:hypothetical protein